MGLAESAWGLGNKASGVRHRICLRVSLPTLHQHGSQSLAHDINDDFLLKFESLVYVTGPSVLAKSLCQEVL